VVNFIILSVDMLDGYLGLNFVVMRILFKACFILNFSLIFVEIMIKDKRMKFGKYL